jgi:hypothetical protein
MIILSLQFRIAFQYFVWLMISFHNRIITDIFTSDQNQLCGLYRFLSSFVDSLYFLNTQLCIAVLCMNSPRNENLNLLV